MSLKQLTPSSLRHVETFIFKKHVVSIKLTAESGFSAKREKRELESVKMREEIN